MTQAMCTGGELQPPTLTPVTTDGITYTADPEAPYAPAQIVVVTATLDDQGVGWPDNLPARLDQSRCDNSHLQGDIRRRGVHPGARSIRR